MYTVLHFLGLLLMTTLICNRIRVWSAREKMTALICNEISASLAPLCCVHPIPCQWSTTSYDIINPNHCHSPNLSEIFTQLMVRRRNHSRISTPMIYAVLPFLGLLLMTAVEFRNGAREKRTQRTRSVSTGLGLSLDNTRVGDDNIDRLLLQQNAEIDRFLFSFLRNA